jgi:flavin-dependent thymidylate synthase
VNTVELLNYYGGDREHALSAWTSTSRDLTPEKEARIPALLKQLAENGHETPFEKSSLHFLVDCEVASHIHLLKHRIGVSINGESARYKELKQDRAYFPKDWPSGLQEDLASYTAMGQKYYHLCIERLVQSGMSRKRAKESARFFLGYNNVTTMDVMFNFRSFMHFQRLRNDEHAQLEIREIAKRMLELTRETGAFEHSLKAFGY